MKTVFLILLLLSTGGCAAKQWANYFGCVATLAALAEQLFDIAQRERVPKVPAHGAKNQLGLRLLPLEDLRSDCLLHGLFRLPAPPAKVATQPPHAFPRASNRLWRVLSPVISVVSRASRPLWRRSSEHLTAAVEILDAVGYRTPD